MGLRSAPRHDGLRRLLVGKLIYKERFAQITSFSGNGGSPGYGETGTIAIVVDNAGDIVGRHRGDGTIGCNPRSTSV